MNKISFNDIVELFNPDEWDIGYLSAEGLLRCGLSPIKYKAHPRGADFTSSIHYSGLTNCIVFAKIGHTWDYTHYEEAEEIIYDAGYENWFPVYTNYKHAAILSGIGVTAKNSLVYNYKFGFDCHYGVIAFKEDIVDVPDTFRVNWDYWHRCEGCDDCAKNCPAGAIHNDKKPYWLNSDACDNFIGISDHPTIPSVKTFWHKNIYPELPKEVVENIKSPKDVIDLFPNSGGVLPFDRNGYTYDGYVTKHNGKPVNIAFCRECTSQPRCSKWNGKFPYQSGPVIEQPIKFVKRKKENE